MLSLLFFFSLLPVPVLCAIALTMYRRKQHRVYLAFWLYVLYQAFRVTVEAVAFFVSYRVYFYSYWIAGFLSVAFNLLLLRDVFVKTLRNYSSLAKFRVSGYEYALSFIWVIGLALTFHRVTDHSYRRMITLSGQAVSFTAVGMFLFVVVCSYILGIKWTEKVCGIASGLGLLGAVDLLFFAALSHGVRLSNNQAGWIETIAYDCAVAIFAFCFLPNRNDKTGPTGIKPEVVEWVESMKGVASK